MTTRGKNINLFLIDGTAAGRIKCTLSNWTGVVYKIPRDTLECCKERADLAQSGVYLLFGQDAQTKKKVVYIGQANTRKHGKGILHRLQEHKRSQAKNFWTEAVVFTTSNHSLGSTEISYLENRFCHMATAAKRYVVQNSNHPALGNVTEEKESELEEFIDNAQLVVTMLGYAVFGPSPAPPSIPARPKNQSAPPPIAPLPPGIQSARQNAEDMMSQLIDPSNPAPRREN